MLVRCQTVSWHATGTQTQVTGMVGMVGMVIVARRGQPGRLEGGCRGAP